MKILQVPQIQAWDAYTIRHEPISPGQLMERAAGVAAQWILDHYHNNQEFALFCGTGNNGGDGLVIARLLAEAGKKVQVFVLECGNRSDDFLINLARLEPLLPVNFIDDDLPLPRENVLVIDALFGTGLNRPLEGKAARLVKAINQHRYTIISIDIPSGLFADKTSMGNDIIAACVTLSFQVYKLAFMMTENARHFGQVHILDIKLHPAFYDHAFTKFYTIDSTLASFIYKPRKSFVHKYNLGHALLYAGSKPMMGAAILCAKACMRSGAGLVTVFTEDQTQGILQVAIPEAISGLENDWKILSHKKGVIGIGPGLQRTVENEKLLREIFREYTGGIVVDATGLQLFAAISPAPRSDKKTFILTPHTGEFEQLFGKASNDFDRLDQCMERAKELNCYIVLKGHHTLIACPDGIGYFNMNGNAGMATAGSGDVLTGFITGLLVQGYSEKEACLLGVYLHGKAGDLAAEKRSQEALIASDIIDSVGDAFKSIQNIHP